MSSSDVVENGSLNDVKNWSSDDVSEWLKCVGLEKCAEYFHHHLINGEILLTMNEHDISSSPLNVDKFGIIRKFGIELEKLKSGKIPIQQQNSHHVTPNGFLNDNNNNPPSVPPEINGNSEVDEQNLNINSYFGYSAEYISQFSLPTQPPNESAAAGNGSWGFAAGGGFSESNIDDAIKYEENANFAEINNEESKNENLDFSKVFEQRSVETISGGDGATVSIEKEEFKMRFIAAENYLQRAAAAAASSTPPPIGPAVMMENTYTSRVTEMEREFSDFCWRLQEDNDLIKQITGKPIYGNLVFVVSPVEFYVQPKFYVKKAMNLLQKMNDFYADDFESIERDKLYERMPCAVQYNEDKHFYRAVVQQIGSEDARVFFVDWGDGQFVPFSAIKPLINDFGRYPPFALRCQITGVRERSLEQKVVMRFKEEVTSLPNTAVKFTILSNVHGNIIVRLFHPTTGEDIGLKYKTREPLVPTYDDSSSED